MLGLGHGEDDWRKTTFQERMFDAAETVHCHFGHTKYCGVIIAHLAPADDPHPELFGITIIGLDNDAGEYANGGRYAIVIQLFPESPTYYAGTRVLAVLS